MKPPFIVTGCQRSGTIITAQILANDYKCTVVDEFGFPPVPRSFEKVNAMIEKGVTNIVIQCPNALHNPIEIFHAIPDLHWIGVVRKKEDILKSMKRVKWRMEDFNHYIDFHLVFILLSTHIRFHSVTTIYYFYLYTYTLTNLLRLFLDNIYMNNTKYNTIQNKITPWVILTIQLILLYLI